MHSSKIGILRQNISSNFELVYDVTSTILPALSHFFPNAFFTSSEKTPQSYVAPSKKGPKVHAMEASFLPSGPFPSATLNFMLSPSNLSFCQAMFQLSHFWYENLPWSGIHSSMASICSVRHYWIVFPIAHTPTRSGK